MGTLALLFQLSLSFLLTISFQRNLSLRWKQFNFAAQFLDSSSRWHDSWRE